ncbi:TPA: cardiotrophin 2-like [Bos taurus]|nr:TPA: cardiotrophin 2-like [Bos taurus]
MGVCKGKQAPGGSAAIGGGGAGRRGARNAQNAGVHGPPRALGPSLRRRPGRRRMEMGGAGGEALPRAAARPFQGEVLLWGAQSLSPPRPTGAPRAQAPFCLLALLLPPLSLGAPMSTAESVNQAYNLALDMQRHISTLLQTYLQDQGRPFSNPRFSSPTLSLETLPSTDMPFEIWHGLEDGVRLSLTQEAFWSFSQHFRIAMVDQHILHHGDSIVEDQLWEARLKAKGLAGNLAAIMTSLGLPSPAANTPLGPVPLGDSAYRKKCRGYVIIRDYSFWTDRAVTFLGELKAKYSQ